MRRWRPWRPWPVAALLAAGLGASCNELALAQDVTLAGAVPAETLPPPTLFDRDLLARAQLRLLGRVSVGAWRPLALRPVLPGDACAGTAPARVASIERSHIGIEGDEALGGAWRAGFALEQSFNAASGGLLRPCGVVFDARSTVSLVERDLGQFDLGRADQPAWILALSADPWRGNGAVSPDWRTYLAPETGATRSSDALTYTSPLRHPLHLALQWGRPRAAGANAYRAGASVWWKDGAWLTGAGWQSWADGSRALPVVLAHDSGSLRIAGAWTRGRIGQADYRNVFIGASGPLMSRGDPERNGWRIGLDQHRTDGPYPGDSKLGLGWVHRLSRHTRLLAGVAGVRQQGQPLRASGEIGLSTSFERDLRWPQPAQ